MKYISESCIWSMRKIREENGQTIVEYALLIVILVLVVIAAMIGVGYYSSNAFNTVTSSLN